MLLKQDLRIKILLGFVLLAVTIMVYWQTGSNEFINFDDPGYVTQNAQVKAGLSRPGLLWAFTSTTESNWHPLTWLSHMMDCQLFGMNPKGHHLVSALLHAANTALLFLFLCRMTGAKWQSAFVAALFALHPLHVESVAWVSERKDVLSTLFGFLTILAYARYVERPSLLRYLTALIAFVLGLMAKPMLVTLPFVLLLLDYWPLGRWPESSIEGRSPSPPPLKLLLEKAPFFFLAAVSSVATFLVQQKGGSVLPLAKLPLLQRIENAIVSYVRYIGKTLWPSDLAVYYPFPENLPGWQVAGSLLVLIGFLLLALWQARRRPYLIVGLLWFLGTLVPVIGLVQVGVQSMADRYTYVPLIGLFLIIGWGIPELFQGWRQRRVFLPIAAAGCLAGLTVCTWQQIGYWQNSAKLFRHAIAVTTANSLVCDKLGLAFLEQGRFDEAIDQFNAALKYQPNNALTYNNLGIAYKDKGMIDEAIENFQIATKLMPKHVEAYFNLGNAYQKKGWFDKAIANYQNAIRLRPEYAEAFNNLGNTYYMEGSVDKAIECFQITLKLNPYVADAHFNLGNIYLRKGLRNQARTEFEATLKLNPGDFEAQRLLNSL